MYKFSFCIFTLFCSCMVVVSCRSGSSRSDDTIGIRPAFDSVAAKKEVVAVNLNLTESLAKGDSVGVANCYATDAKFMAPGSPAIVGRQNIQSTFASFIKAGAAKLDINMLNLWGNADVLAEEGTFTLSTKDGHRIDKGKYIVLWKKEDGKWKIARDCNNSDLPAPASN